MTQSQLNRAVADATGETVGAIQTRGFSLGEEPEDLPSAESLIQQYHARKRPRRRRHRVARAAA